MSSAIEFLPIPKPRTFVDSFLLPPDIFTLTPPHSPPFLNVPNAPKASDLISRVFSTCNGGRENHIPSCHWIKGHLIRPSTLSKGLRERFTRLQSHRREGCKISLKGVDWAIDYTLPAHLQANSRECSLVHPCTCVLRCEYLRWPNTVFARAFADVIQHVHKDFKKQTCRQ